MRVSFMVNNKPLQDAQCPRAAGLEPEADSQTSPGTDSAAADRKADGSLQNQILLTPKTPLDGLFLSSSKNRVKSYFDQFFLIFEFRTA